MEPLIRKAIEDHSFRDVRRSADFKAGYAAYQANAFASNRRTGVALQNFDRGAECARRVEMQLWNLSEMTRLKNARDPWSGVGLN